MLPPCTEAAPFDAVAERYDQEMESNPSMQRMRRVSLALLERAFAPGMHLLEIGCGTGAEALALARRGVRILATDPSAAMLQAAQRKAQTAGLAPRVTWRQMRAHKVASLVGAYGRGAFDGAYASFGPLNGEPDLRPVAAGLAELLRPGALFVTGVLNRFYGFETAWYLAHARPAQAFRRWSGRALAPVAADAPADMDTHYYTPGSVARAFRPWFRCVACRALAFLLPPPFAGALWTAHPSLWRAAEPWEERLAPHWPCNRLGDHALLTFQRVEDQ